MECLDPYVLVIEDDESFAESLAAVLEGAGYRVVFCPDVRLGLEYLAQRKVLPSVILLDFGMPEMDGWDFLAAQGADPRISTIPVVGMSAMDEVHEDHATRTRVAALLRKPLAAEAILDAVGRLAGPRSPVGS
jgi:CheY-like chemotaxis protein